VDLSAKVGERVRAGVDVHADNGLPALNQKSDEAVADKASAADNKYRHTFYDLYPLGILLRSTREPGKWI
jgi:hypothetical protein